MGTIAYAFGIKPVRKYLAVAGIAQYKQHHSFRAACEWLKEHKQAYPQHSGNYCIYEKLGKGAQSNWYILASLIRGRIISEVIGQSPND